MDISMIRDARIGERLWKRVVIPRLIARSRDLLLKDRRLFGGVTEQALVPEKITLGLIGICVESSVCLCTIDEAIDRISIIIIRPSLRAIQVLRRIHCQDQALVT